LEGVGYIMITKVKRIEVKTIKLLFLL